MKSRNDKQDRRGGAPVKLSARTKSLAISLAVNSLLLLFIYFGTMNLNVVVLKAGVLAPYPIFIGQVVYYAYWLVFAGFLIAYIAYNRAFSRKGLTADMLPDSWSEDKKQAYIEDGVKRQEKSKWMLSVIIPFLITIMADALYLFVWDGFLSNLLDGFLLTAITTLIGA